jgi:hypothetical protein
VFPSGTIKARAISSCIALSPHLYLVITSVVLIAKPKTNAQPVLMLLTVKKLKLFKKSA